MKIQHLATGKCHDCERRFLLQHLTEVATTRDGWPTYRCGACEANPDWRGCDPRAK